MQLLSVWSPAELYSAMYAYGLRYVVAALFPGCSAPASVFIVVKKATGQKSVLGDPVFKLGEKKCFTRARMALHRVLTYACAASFLATHTKQHMLDDQSTWKTAITWHYSHMQ